MERPRTVRIKGAEQYSGLGRSTLYEEMKAGNLKFIQFGGIRLIELDELDRLIDGKAASEAA